MNKDHSTLFIFGFIFIVFAFGVGGSMFLRSRTKAAEKRLWFRRYTISVAVVFGCFTAFMVTLWGQPAVMLFFAPALAFVPWINYRNTYICDSCSKMSYSTDWFPDTYHCPKCGHKIR